MKQLTLLLIVLLGLSIGGCIDSSTPEASPLPTSALTPIQNDTTPIVEQSPDVNPTSLPTVVDNLSPAAQTLETAYDNNDKGLLLDFFYNWQNRILPLSNSEVAGQPPEVRAAYNVFTEFYNQFPQSRIEYSQWNPDHYKDVEFIIVQDKISIRTVDDGSVLSARSIKDFRPELEFEEAGVVYLTDEYRQLLITFLDRDGSCQGYWDSNDRSHFLNQLVKVKCNHWGGGWIIQTHPNVSSIEFNPELTQATVKFLLVYEFCEAVFSKSDGQWVMIDLRLIAVE